MKDIEKYIIENREDFNIEEPKEGHFDRFRDKLEDKKENRFMIIVKKSYKFAAVLLFLISFYVVFTNIEMSDSNSADLLNDIKIEESGEAFAYYNSLVEDKLNEFGTLECQNLEPQKANINSEIAELESSYKELKIEYEKNPDNLLIYNAIITNYQMRIDFLDMVINKLNNYC